MNRAGQITLDLQKLLYSLFCLYAFSLPFELVFEYLLGIQTIFKPFRIVALSIIGVFGLKVLKEGLWFNKAALPDFFIYLIFFYGLVVSLFQIIFGVFNMGLFFNDTFLIGLNMAVFFVFKNIPMNRKQVINIFQFFIAGVLINSIYTFSNLLGVFYGGRHSGFIDNPNYASLGIAMGISFVLLRFSWPIQRINFLKSIFGGIILLIAFASTGSRAGLVIFIFSLLLIFILSSLRKKFLIVVFSLVLTLFILPGQLDQSSSIRSLSMIKRVSKKLDSEVEDVRFVIWRGVFRTLENEGYFGMGIGQFKAKFSRYYNLEPNKLILEIVNRDYFLSTHNDYLALLTDYGLPGLCFYLLFLFLIFRIALIRIQFRSGNEEEDFLNNFQFLIILSLIGFGMAAENFQHPLYWFLLMLASKKFYTGVDLTVQNTSLKTKL